MENKSWLVLQGHLVWLRISFLLIHAARCKHHVALAPPDALAIGRVRRRAPAARQSNELMSATQH